MKSASSKPSAADQAAVCAALDTCCKVDTSVISFFGKKRNVNNPTSSDASARTSSGSKQIPLSVQVVSTHSHGATSEGPLPSSLTPPTKHTKVVVEDNETFC